MLATDCAHHSSARPCTILTNIFGTEGQRIVRELGFDALTFDALAPAEIPSRQAGDTQASPSASTITAGSSQMVHTPAGVTVADCVLPFQGDFQHLTTALRNHFGQLRKLTLERRPLRNPH